MATRLSGTYYSGENADEYQVFIDDADYASAALSFGCTSLVFSWNGETEERFNPIMTSTCEIGIRIDRHALDLFVTDLVGAEEERFTVKINKNSALYWVGLIQADQIREEDRPRANGKRFLLRASDGIGRLKDIDYNNAGTAYSGRDTIMAHLLKVLGKNSVLQGYWGVNDIYITSVVDWWETNQTYNDATEPLTITRADHRVFITIDKQGTYTYKSAYDVLEQFCRLFMARFFHANGRYYFLQIAEYAETGNVVLRHFVKAGTYDSNTVSGSFAIYDKEWGNVAEVSADLIGLAAAEWNFFPALNEVDIIYKHFSIRNLAPAFVDWTQAVTTEQVIDDVDDNGGASRIAFYGDLTWRVSMATFQPVTLLLRFQVRIDDGATEYYLKRQGIVSGGQFGYGPVAWQTGQAYFEAWTQLAYANNTTFYIRIPQPNGAITPDLPQSGDLYFKLQFGNAYNAAGQIVVGTNHTYELKNFYAELLIDGTPEGQYNETRYPISNTDATTNSAKVKQEILLGDGPTGNAFGALQVFDGAGWPYSTAWRKGNAGTYDYKIGELLGVEIMAGQITPARKWLGRVRGDLEIYSTLVRDSYNLISAGARLDVSRDIWDGEWFVISRNPTPILVADSEAMIGDDVDIDAPSTNPGGPGPGAPTTTIGVALGEKLPKYPDIGGIEVDTPIVADDPITAIAINPSTQNELYFIDDAVILVNLATGLQQKNEVAAIGKGSAASINIYDSAATTDFPEGSVIIPDPEQTLGDIIWGRRKFFRFPLYDYDENFTSSAAYVTINRQFFRPIYDQDSYDLAEKAYLRSAYWEIGQPEGTTTPQYQFRVYAVGAAVAVATGGGAGDAISSSDTELWTRLENDVYLFQVKRSDGGSATHSKGLVCTLEIVNKHFRPDDVPGMIAWLRADTGITLISSAVSQWNDQSGNANHATQGTAANRPTVVYGVANGWPAILFDGINDRLDIGDATTLVNLHYTGGTVFVVFQPGIIDDPDDIYGILSNTADSDGDIGFGIIYDDQSGTPVSDRIRTYVRNGNVGQTVVNNASADDAIEPNRFSLLTAVFDPDNGTAANRSRNYVNNGAAIANNAATATASSSNATRAAQIGSNGVGGWPLAGYIAEIIIYDTALNNTDRGKVARFLSRKYNLPI